MRANIQNIWAFAFDLRRIFLSTLPLPGNEFAVVLENITKPWLGAVKMILKQSSILFHWKT